MPLIRQGMTLLDATYKTRYGLAWCHLQDMTLLDTTYKICHFVFPRYDLAWCHFVFPVCMHQCEYKLLHNKSLLEISITICSSIARTTFNVPPFFFDRIWTKCGGQQPNKFFEIGWIVSIPKQHPLQCWLLILVQERLRNYHQMVLSKANRRCGMLLPPRCHAATPWFLAHPSICRPCGSYCPLRDAVHPVIPANPSEMPCTLQIVRDLTSLVAWLL